MKKNIFTIILAVLIVGSFILYLIGFTVRTTEIAVVTTWGDITRVINGKTDAGLHWKYPWPVQKVIPLSTRIKVHSSVFEETFTKDELPVMITVSIGWRISDGRKFAVSGKTEKNMHTELNSIVRTKKAGVMGKHPLSHMVNLNTEKLRYDEIEAEMQKDIAAVAESEYGVEIVLLKIEKVGLPKDVSKSVFERMIADRENEAEKHISEGNKQAIEIRAEADRLRSQIMAEAEGEAKRTRGEGEVLAARHYEVFKKDPELAIFLRKLEALEKTLKENTTLVLDRETAPFDLLQSKDKAR